MIRPILAGLCALVVAAGATTAGASEAGRLDMIRKTGTIRIGFPDASPPFAFLDNDGKPIGYSLEICEHVAGGSRHRSGSARSRSATSRSSRPPGSR